MLIEPTSLAYCGRFDSTCFFSKWHITQSDDCRRHDLNIMLPVEVLHSRLSVRANFGSVGDSFPLQSSQTNRTSKTRSYWYSLGRLSFGLKCCSVRSIYRLTYLGTCNTFLYSSFGFPLLENCSSSKQ